MKIYETCPWTSDSRFHVRAPRMVQQKVAFFSQQLLRILLARKGFQRAVRTCLGIRQFRRMPKATRSAVTKAQTVIVIRIVVINTGIAQGRASQAWAENGGTLGPWGTCSTLRVGSQEVQHHSFSSPNPAPNTTHSIHDYGFDKEGSGMFNISIST